MARQPFNPDLAVGGSSPKPAKLSGQSDLTVSQITRSIKSAIEMALPTTVHVVGQLSNVKKHSSGHLYFTLKDEGSELGCVMWRSQADQLKFKPEDGADVRATGSISVFERTGRYQLYARKIEPLGVGAMELAFRQLCEKLKAEGLFDPVHKKKLPRFPQRIGVVTSPTGAAIEDIIDTLKRRFPSATVYLYPAIVQGPGAPKSIVTACRSLNQRSDEFGGLDVLIVGRGGGSAEDLAAFNDEAVARAIFASKIPVISAVGHEADISVADLVADVRAATPTAAAELAVPNTQDVLDELRHRGELLERQIRHRVQLWQSTLASEARRKAFAQPLAGIEDRLAKVSELVRKIDTQLTSQMHQSQKSVAMMESQLRRISPEVLFEAQRGRLLRIGQRLIHSVNLRRQAAQHDAHRMTSRMAYVSPEKSVSRHNQTVATLSHRIGRGLDGKLEGWRQKCGAVRSRLEALSHKNTLARGFSITRLKKGGKLIRSLDDLKGGDRIVTELVDGSIDSRVLDKDQPELFE
ncbi:MAG TPA: exodeoxyribonuclease VII large subunit [Phycisphaerae bacterium]|nr:exodeoxyribonuclease VII large subunit [Phycisphaerae bacterium]